MASTNAWQRDMLNVIMMMVQAIAGHSLEIIIIMAAGSKTAALESCAVCMHELDVMAK